MKVIFLDIDGVLNSFSTLPEKDEGLVGWLDQSNTVFLNDIVQSTNSYLVVSSTWRLQKTTGEIQELLAKAGCQGVVLDSTPNLKHKKKKRFEEIHSWLQATKYNIEKFVILDDETYMGDLSEYHIQTDSQYGLTQKNSSDAVEILNGN